MAHEQSEAVRLSYASLYVFHNRDEASRIKISKETYHPDINMYESDRVTSGLAAVEERMKELNTGNDYEFQATSEAVENNGLVCIEWNFGPPGGEPVVRGTDIALVEDGKIRKLWANFK